MKRYAVLHICLGGLSLFILSCSSTNGIEQAGTNETRRMVWDGENRRFELHVPANYDPQTPAPLVIAFHGSGDTGLNFKQGIGFDREGGPKGFITAYPSSVVSNWAEGCNCNNADRLQIDDIGFTEAILDTLQAEFNIDAGQVYAIGFSQGALYVQRVACEMADQFTAIASVASTMSVPLSERCRPARPISMLILHGTEDPIFPWEGTDNGALSLLGADEAVAEWVRHNNCFPGFDSDVERTDSGRRVRHKVYNECEAGTKVHLYAIEGGGHEWPRSPNTSRLIADFFAMQRRSN